jgi:hypothetical protein
MKQKIENTLNSGLEQYIKALEASDQSLIRDRVMSFPQSKKTRQGGGKQGYIISSSSI